MNVGGAGDSAPPTAEPGSFFSSRSFFCVGSSVLIAAAADLHPEAAILIDDDIRPTPHPHHAL